MGCVRGRNPKIRFRGDASMRRNTECSYGYFFIIGGDSKMQMKLDNILLANV